MDGLIGTGSSEGREPDDVAWLGFVKPDPLKASWQPQSPGMIVLMVLLFQNSCLRTAARHLGKSSRMEELFFFRRLSDVTTFVTPVLPEILEKDVEIKVLKLNHRPRKTLVIIDGVSVRGVSRVVFMGFGERKKRCWTFWL